LKILIVPSWYPTKQNPLHGIFFKEQAEALSEYSVNVSVFYFKLYDRSRVWKNPNWILPSFQFKKVNGVKLFTFRWLYLFRNKLFMRGQEKLLFYLIMKLVRIFIKIDIIHVHSSFNAGVNVYNYCKKSRIPYVITEHSSIFLRNVCDENSLKLVKLIIDNSVTTIAVSEHLKSELVRSTGCQPSKVIYIPNIVDLGKFPLKRSTNNSIVNFSTICFLNENKGIDLLIYSFSELIKKGYNVKLNIGGDGELLSDLRHLSLKLGIDNNIIFLGRLNRLQVRDLLQKTDIYVSTSYVETFGVTLIEALATGIPLVATNSGGPASIVNEGNGILVRTGSSESIMEGMEYILGKLESYIPEKLRKDAYDRFSKESVIKRIDAIYKKYI